MTSLHGPPSLPAFGRPQRPASTASGATTRTAPRSTPATPRSAPKRRPAPAAPTTARTAPPRPRNTAAPEIAIAGHRRTGIPRLLLATLAVAALAVVGGAQVLQSSETATVGYELAALEQERSLLAAEIRLAEADVARLSRRDEIRVIAETRLGMVEATESINIAVSTDVPRVVPLPERYVAPVPAFEPRTSNWWDRLAGFLPGAH